MNREEYISYLENQNSYCECPDLAELFGLGRAAERESNRADFMKDNVDLQDVSPNDRPFLLDYRHSVQKLNTTIERYKLALDKSIINRRISLMLHDDKTFSPSGIITTRQYEELLPKDPIVTFHCSNCNQQIDVVEN